VEDPGRIGLRSRSGWDELFEKSDKRYRGSNDEKMKDREDDEG